MKQIIVGLLIALSSTAFANTKDKVINLVQANSQVTDKGLKYTLVAGFAADFDKKQNTLKITHPDGRTEVTSINIILGNNSCNGWPCFKYNLGNGGTVEHYFDGIDTWLLRLPSMTENQLPIFMAPRERINRVIPKCDRC